jgi:divalent metal cation (Fe/Co/Zn/Cd) transporter
MNRIPTHKKDSAEDVSGTISTLCVFCLAILLSDYCADAVAWPWIEFAVAVVISFSIVKPLLNRDKGIEETEGSSVG